MGTPVVASDAELAALISQTPSTGVLAALGGGDLCRTLGGRGDVGDRLGADATLVDVDIGRVEADGKTVGYFAAHVLIRGRAWSGQAAAVMNAEWMGEWDLAPRAHPGDGLLDILEGALGPRDLLLARRRAPAGDHLPHPNVKVRRASSARLEFTQKRLVWVDGVSVGSHRVVTVELTDQTVTVAV